MGVYIKDMEMPTNCMDCPLEMPFCDLWTNEKFAALKVVNRYEERHPDCPLISVPEPHGRLIDADALAHDLDYDVEISQRALDEMDFVGKERERVQFDKDCKQNCMWYLSNAPTVIPAEGRGE